MSSNAVDSPGLGTREPGHRLQLSRRITLVESSRAEDRRKALQLLTKIRPYSGQSLRLGISGTPGVGKSTFIEALGLHLLREEQRSVAVLAVDPSSPIRGGSLLGDRTRMEQLGAEPGAFIRPTPARGSLGGVARSTREAILLCEAAGYDTVLIETVGVGQSEYKVAEMVDFFVLLIQPAAGDELQGIKRGVLELADVVVINKDDGELQTAAQLALEAYRGALRLGVEGAQIELFRCSALEKRGIDTIWTHIEKKLDKRCQDGSFERRRAGQNRAWMSQLLGELLEQRLAEHPGVAELRQQLAPQVERGGITPHYAASQLIDCFFNSRAEQR